MPRLTCWNREICPQKFTPPTIILLPIIIGTYICMCVCVYIFYIYVYIYIGIYLNIENLIYNLHLGVLSLSLSGGLLTIIIKHVTRYIFFFSFIRHILSFNKQCPCKKRRRDWREGWPFLSVVGEKIRGGRGKLWASLSQNYTILGGGYNVVSREYKCERVASSRYNKG